jgi:hypothetical protein
VYVLHDLREFIGKEHHIGTGLGILGLFYHRAHARSDHYDEETDDCVLSILGLLDLLLRHDLLLSRLVCLWRVYQLHDSFDERFA